MDEHDATPKPADGLDSSKWKWNTPTTLDYHDVAAMVAKAQNEERAARQRHIDDVTRDLRAEFRREVIELREEMGELFAQTHATIRSVSDACDAGDNALQRVIDARAEQAV